MYKQFIQYEDLDENLQSCTLFFHLRRTEIIQDMKLEILEKRVSDFKTSVLDRGDGEMSIPEVREFLDIIKIMVRASYGIRDGQNFYKERDDPKIWTDFVASGRYDGLIWWLFDEPQRANDFLANVWPKDIREAVVGQSQDATVRVIENAHLKDVSFTDAEHAAPHTSVSTQNERTIEELQQIPPHMLEKHELVRLMQHKTRQGGEQE